MLFVIIPVHNRVDFTLKCLESLEKQTYKEFKIILVDDGSTDNTVEVVAEKYKDVEILQADGSLWWTASINLGIKRALEENASLILTLNNDTIAPIDYLANHIKWHKAHPDYILGSYAIDQSTHEPVYGGAKIDWKFAKTINLLDKVSDEDRNGLHEVTHFPGRGLLIPVSVINKIGLFDAKVFPHYFADYEFTYRAVHKGFKVFCNFDAKLYTYPNESGAEKIRNNKTLNGYFDHLFGIKGGGNLKNFYKFAFKYCPPLLLPQYLFIGTFRRTFGYFLK